MSKFATMPLWAIEHEAMTLNCRVVIAEANQLQFDIDDDEGRSKFAHFYIENLFMRFGDKLPREHWTSRSGNDHWVLTLPDAFSVEERIAMQVLGGSDPGREWAALCCHWDGSPHPILLYRPLPKLLTAGCPCRCHTEGLNPIYCRMCACGNEWHDGGGSVEAVGKRISAEAGK